MTHEFVYTELLNLFVQNPKIYEILILKDLDDN